MAAVDTVRMEMIEAGGRTVQSFGLNRLLGQIYTLLYLSSDPLSLDDMVKELAVSKASVSIASRQLASWGAIRPVWQRGDRKDYYTAERDFKSILNNGILESIRKKMDSAQRQVERSLEMLEKDGDNGEQIAFVRNRLKEADTFRARIQRLMDNPVVRKVL